MNTTYTDIQDGTRLDITVAFVTRRSMDVPAGSLDRLRVTDTTGRSFPIVTTPDHDAPLDLKTGETHQVRNLLCAVPPRQDGRVTAPCPDCEGELREGQTIDAAGADIRRAIADLGVDRPSGSSTTERVSVEPVTLAVHRSTSGNRWSLAQGSPFRTSSVPTVGER